MAKEKRAALEGEPVALRTLALVQELFIEAIEELKSIRRCETSTWKVYEELRDEAMEGLHWCEAMTQRANPTGPNVGIRQEQSPPRSPAETD